MTDYQMLSTALAIARNAHKGQVDKGGEDYIFHPVTVALLCNSTKEKVVALLHDTIEDHPECVSYQSLQEAGFDNEILDALRLVTHIKDTSYIDFHQEYRANIRKIGESKNKIAIHVKLADLMNNTDISRMNGKKAPKYDDYLWAIEYLKSCE